MYTWGYIKDVTLAKLDLDETEAEVQNLLTRFAYFANEAITQICSSVKPKYTFFEIEITDENIGEPITMPNDFISFGDDVNKIKYQNRYGETIVESAHDADFEYLGNNRIICKRTGKFYISYNARWITFTNQDDNYEIDVPNDILDCLPSYIASQCMKIDDEYKSTVYRNEYEMFLARIDNTHYKNTKTFKIEGDW